MPSALVSELLSRACDEACRASADVRIAARLRMARVEALFDRAAAQITLEMLIGEAQGIRDQLTRDSLLQLAVRVAAAVAPALLDGLFRDGNHPPQRFEAGTLLRIMLAHGHPDAAADFLLRDVNPGSFPFAFVGNVLAQTTDAERRLELMRTAVQVWRFSPHAEFLWLFETHWEVLPAAEARSVLQEIVQRALSTPESPMRATFDEGRLRFTSHREHTLFEVLHIMRRLEPRLAETLVRAHPQLRAGAARYPNGWESILAENEQRRARLGAAAAPPEQELVLAGGKRDTVSARPLRETDFQPALDEALQRYAQDADPMTPNRIAKEFWPSAARYRGILHAAGRKLGDAAQVHLDAIPDAELRLLATVELAAALAGLPELPAVQREYRPDRHRRHDGQPKWQRRWPGEQYSSAGQNVFGNVVRCPACEWLPTEQDCWECRCGHQWNTFASRGRCPACRYQWEITGCQSCGQVSPHRDWYVNARKP